jgi:arylsulfatase A-like enzyme
VFLIVVDTLRPDRLSCYGYEAHATPNIDALARRGVRFSRAQSVASWTIPSMGAMMTSRYPTQLGLTETPAPEGKRFAWQELRDQQNWTLSRGEHTLAEAFRQAGYRTAAFIDQPGLIAYGGFFQGFDDVYFPISARAITRFEPGKLEYPRWPPFLRDAFGNDEELIVRFEAWLAESGNRKMFVWLHLLTPHWPYDPAPSYMPNGEAAETDEQQLEERFYNGEVRAVDDLIGRIARAIDEHVGLGRSVIVFTSDHGEGLGEHGLHDHGHSLHAEVIEVPLILSAPSLPDRGAVGLDVRTIDIAPTLLDLVGRGDAVPPDFEGASLLPLIEGDDVVLPVFSQAMLYGETERSLGGGNFKLMYDEQEDSYRLFDIPADPAEAHDVASSHPGTVERLRDALAAIHARLVVDGERRSAEASPESTARDERMLEALRSLGYVK